MHRATFVDKTRLIVDEYLTKIWRWHQTNSGFKLLYPTHLIIMEMDDHFAFELVGCTVRYAGLRQKARKCQDITNYSDLFGEGLANAKPLVRLDSNSTGGFTGLALAHYEALSSIKERFPVFANYGSVLTILEGAGPLILDDGLKEDMIISDCVFASKRGNAVRGKHINFLYVTKKTTTGSDYVHRLWLALKDGSNLEAFWRRGITPLQEELQAKLVLGQLHSIFMEPGYDETTLGDFINEHPRIITKGFNCQSFLYEPSFKWKVSRSNEKEHFINPDLLIKRGDGYYDIVDLKLALSGKSKITRGKIRRRRFIEYVYEGIAQLVNYQEYFDFPENAAYAEKEFDVRVKEPTLYLVVGNAENTDENEIRQALLAHSGRKICLINYDTLALNLIR